MQILDGTKLDFDDVLIVPRPTELISRSEVNLIVSYICKHSGKQIRGIPVIVANLDTTGTIPMAQALYSYKIFVALHKYIAQHEIIKFFHTPESKYSFYTTGINDEDLKQLKSISLQTNLPRINIDVANGYMYSFLDKIKYIRNLYPDTIIMAGTVCTPEGVENIIKAGADICRCGIGNGNLCDTSNKAGVGYKQFSVAVECGQAANELNALCCSDGGCKTPADVCKALGAGSRFVMCGSLFCGYDECEGEWEYLPEVEWYHKKQGDTWTAGFATGKQKKRRLKAYGMSSKVANDKYNQGLKEYRTSEGKERWFDYRGLVDTLAQDIKGSLASCCTYTNTKNLENLWKNCCFSM